VRPVNGNGRKREEQLEGQQAASEKVYEQFKALKLDHSMSTRVHCLCQSQGRQDEHGVVRAGERITALRRTIQSDGRCGSGRGELSGVGVALPDLMSGRLEVMFVPVATAIGYLKSGTLQPLGVTATTRVDVLPGFAILPRPISRHATPPLPCRRASSRRSLTRWAASGGPGVISATRIKHPAPWCSINEHSVICIHPSDVLTLSCPAGGLHRAGP
jgi:hypothetical protein